MTIKEQLSVGIKSNINEYMALLNKATNLSMQLKNTIDEINNFIIELEVIKGGDDE